MSKSVRGGTTTPPAEDPARSATAAAMSVGGGDAGKAVGPRPTWSSRLRGAAKSLLLIPAVCLMSALPALAQTARPGLVVDPLAPIIPISLVPSFKDYPVAAVLASLLFLVVLTMAFYGIRHFMFTMNRLVGVQRHPYIDISVARWPMITVFIAAHNEEKVIAGCIEALLNTDYPAD